ncbi:hypothetical protein E9993_11640 [Labilibacter sediminis]|nr:hypothetical protein E9993_11640 [Labilibacter sediminis]
MYIVIEKYIERTQLITKQKCIKALSDYGMEIIDSEKLIFSENYNMSTDLSENRQKVFKTLLKGQILIDENKSVIQWKLRMGGILFKAILIWTIITLMFPILYESNLLISFIIGGIAGFLIFIFSRTSLNNKVNTLTEIITAHNKAHS